MTRSGLIILLQRAGGWCKSAEGFFMLNHLRAASLKIFLIIKADGARPLQRGAMLVAVI